MPIQINTSGNMTVFTEPKTYDSVWITNINIMSPSPTREAEAMIMVAPYNTQTQELDRRKMRQIRISDVFAEATGNAAVANAVTNIFAYVQQRVISDDLFPPT
jgi:hypothetical protein